MNPIRFRITQWAALTGAAVCFAGALGWPDVVQACPTCKEALSTGGGDLVSGFFWSILFMLSAPFLIFTGMATYFYVLVRRHRRRGPSPALAALAVPEATAEEETATPSAEPEPELIDSGV